MKDKVARLKAQEDCDEASLAARSAEQERQNRLFFEELSRAKAEADKFTREHLERQARQDRDDIIEFLKRNEKETADYFKVTEEQTKELDEEYLKTAMKHLFEEKEKFSQLFHQG